MSSVSFPAVDGSGGGLVNDGQSSGLPSISAGVCRWDGSRVTPDPRKGTLKIINGPAGKRELLWQLRPSEEVEWRLPIVEQLQLQKIEQCKTGRVYVVKFNSNADKRLFWLQEPDASNDEALVRAFNLAARPPPASAGSFQPTDAQELLRQFAASLHGSTAAERRSTSQQQQQPTPLSAVLTGDVLATLASDPKAVEELQTLMPTGQTSAAATVEALRCPQLLPALSSLTSAIYSDQLPIILRSLGR
eukprot:GHVT01081004.1.p1 GENE.GHVT01081004.1~~GHVT01081004.1.p1  ORF type:complete len:247 (-),score=55.67 GHVT01081004.1:416-1156(-)